MKRISVGDLVYFQLTTGQSMRGIVVQAITERHQPTMFLIERHDGGRAIRLDTEIDFSTCSTEQIDRF
jgi:hypothetical protein